MDWVQDMTARWVRIMSATDGGSTPLDEAVEQISAIGVASGKKGRLRRLTQNTSASGEDTAVTALSRQLVAGVLVSDLLIGQLCAATGQSREHLLDQFAGDVPQQLRDQRLRALQAELSGSCARLRNPERVSYAGLGSRVEELLRLAEEQASAIVDQARAAAAEITSAAGEKQPCPQCGAS